jgi:hypothetical protein
MVLKGERRRDRGRGSREGGERKVTPLPFPKYVFRSIGFNLWLD